MNNELAIAILTAPGRTGRPAAAIAATRAGALGILNLEFTLETAAAKTAIEELVRHSAGNIGIKLSSASRDLFDTLFPHLTGTIVLTAEDAAAVPEMAAQLKSSGHRVWLEATSSEDAALGECAGVDALIAKGHESGGWVGDETTFVLLQRLVKETRLPVWAQGGIGLHTVGACAVAGAAGVILDYQVALTRESNLPGRVKERIAALDGSETVCLGAELGMGLRVYTRPRLPGVAALQDMVQSLAAQPRGNERRTAWREAVVARVGWSAEDDNVWPMGQDACFAASLAERYRTVGGVIAAFRQAVSSHIQTASKLRPLDACSPLAASHGTRYPIVQGPMTRVSDTAEFALSVAKDGGLPFLALALMRGAEADQLIHQTKDLLGERSWGVGILGFIPAELRKEQLEVIQRYKPPYVLIAGGRPDQARQFEKEGIHTYLHVPSPGLLRNFVQDGARRFVFEGRECGGHIGPRTSFVLWNSMIDVLLATLPTADAAQCHVLFAGGVHDARSAAMVAAIAAPLVELGVCIGVLVGTAYLFTEESISGGAILPGFQRKAVECRQTAVVESGPGYAIRCVANPFTEEFDSIKQCMLTEGRSAEDVRNALEEMNVGRLRIASKGLKRNPDYQPGSNARRLVAVDVDEQNRDGMYMIGQVSALHDRITTIAALHDDIAVGSVRDLENNAPFWTAEKKSPPAKPARIAIVGLSCILPKASDTAKYWDNILNKVYAITEIPKHRWNWEEYFDADRTAKDKIYSKWGGFLDDLDFDPLEFGMPPNSLPSIDPMQLLALKAAKAAIDDAGYLDRPFDRSRAGVILGASGGSGELGTNYGLRGGLPMLFGESAGKIIEESQGILPEWTEDSFAGLLPNVAAGRIANRFDLGGMNYVVDAACASSLAAVHIAAQELESGTADMVLIGGIDTVQTPFGYLCFSKTQALSPTGQPRTFDAAADGIAISEGFAFAVLKRLDDAERDGDRIYAVLQATGASSDGKAKGLTAPRMEGQVLALERAYAKAGFSPTTVELFEAHGTGTVVGDRTEAVALSEFLERNGARPASHAVGSVKSMIGHTKATAGVAALVKATLSLYNKVLPPTLNVTTPNPKARFGEGPLYVNSETRPWIHAADTPRRAGVSAFGFGGTNFHAVVEEYSGEYLGRQASSSFWPSELLLWCAPSAAELTAALAKLQEQLGAGARPALHDLAFSLSGAYERNWSPSAFTLAIVASRLEELGEKLTAAKSAIADSKPDEPRGIFYSSTPLARAGSVAFLFPGQGSQYCNMLRDLAIHFDEARQAFELADRVLGERSQRPLSEIIFPPPAFRPEEEKAQLEALTATDVAQPALGAAEIGMLRLLDAAGVSASMFAGHSYGEFAALHAGGVFDAETLIQLSGTRGRSMIDAAKGDLGTMAAVSAGAEQVATIIAAVQDVWLANLNAPKQTVISGTRTGIERAVKELQQAGLAARTIPVGCAFHSPIVAPAQERLAAVLAQCPLAPPHGQVFSNTTGAAYPQDPQAIAALLSNHLASPVRFLDEIEAMYAAGARIFVEVGPRNVLSGLVHNILGSRPHLAAATDQPGRSGITQLQTVLAQLAANGLAIRPAALFRHRKARLLDLNRLVEETTPKPLPATAWMVNGSRALPRNQSAPVVRRPLWKAETSTAVPSPPPRAMAAAASQQDVSKSQPLPPPMALSTAGGATDDVMLQFQNLMSKFLDTQRQVMTTYLRGGTVTPGAVTEAPQAYVPRISDPVVEAPPPLPEPARPAAVAPVIAAVGIPKREELERRLLEIVSERTGYPPDMLKLDADVEAELGIDSIKRVEIIGALQRAFLAEDGQLGEESMEQLAAVKTFGGVVDWILKAVESLAGRGLAVPAARKDAESSVPRYVLPSKEQLTSRLLQVVSDRTGYPLDMLKTDSDVEAELGIDSIKRVEIIGSLQREFLAEQDQLGEEAMQQLTSVKTLGGIVDWIHGALERFSTEGPALPDSLIALNRAAANTTIETGRETVPRLRMIAVESPAVESAAFRLDASRPILIAGEDRGIDREVADLLRAHGARVIMVRTGSALRAVDADVFEADLSSLQGAEALVGAITERIGLPAGIVHLLALNSSLLDGMGGLAEWRSRLRIEVKSLFYLLRSVGSALREPGSAPCFAIAATPMGGKWGFGGHAFFAGHGAIAGLMKTAGQEWPGVKCKAIDTDPLDSAKDIARVLIGELATGNGEVQVGYTGEKRWIQASVPAPLDESQPSVLPLGSDSVVLITGGARGITAEVAIHLAKAYRPKIVIASRSPLPSAVEGPETANASTAKALKPALIQELRREGREFTVAQVEAACTRILREREIRQNLERLRQAGVETRYLQVDVTDAAEMAALVRRIQADYGRLDGVIHGAGIIEDKKIQDKTADSFDRVFDTKADSAFLLGQLLPSEGLQFVVLFSSAAAAYGNVGQCDYAAANEILNRFAMQWDARWPGRVVAMGWGPWASSGMVDPLLQKIFEERGIQLISLPAGCEAVERELRLGHKGDSSLLFGAWDAPAAPAPQPPTSSSGLALPLLVGARRAQQSGTVEVFRTFDPERDIFLADHRLDGVPVFPFAMAAELIAEAAQSRWPDLHLHAIRGMQLMKGITFENGPRTLRVSLRASADGPAEHAGATVAVEITDAERPELRLYRATVELVDRMPAPPPLTPLLSEPLAPFAKSVEEMYRDWMFHGPIFQGIVGVDGISRQGAVSRMRPSEPRQHLRGVSSGEWLIDPTVFDSSLQMIILWSRQHHDMTPLPSRFASYRRFGSLSVPGIRCEATIKSDMDGHLLKLTIRFLDPQGRLLGLLEDMEATASKELNRLAGGAGLAKAADQSVR